MDNLSSIAPQSSNHRILDILVASFAAQEIEQTQRGIDTVITDCINILIVVSSENS